MAQLDARLAELNRRVALVMSKLDIKDDVSKQVEELLEAKIEEARTVVNDINTAAAQRAKELIGDLKRIEESVKGGGKQ